MFIWIKQFFHWYGDKQMFIWIKKICSFISLAYSHRDTRASRSILRLHFYNSLKIWIVDYLIAFFMFIRKTIIPIKKWS